MFHPENSHIDPETGNVSYLGSLERNKGSHAHMPARTGAYLPADEKGHVNASSLGGVNDRSNVVAQNHDVNCYSFGQVERGERAALKNGASIESKKTAIVNGLPGDRPQNFTISDTVTYADGHTEQIHHSFVNASYADQQAWNDLAASLPDTFDAPNPGDGLRDSMSVGEYAELMEETDAKLPGLAAEYAPADFSGLPAGGEVDARDWEGAASTDPDADPDAGPEAGGEAEATASPDPDADGDFV